MLGELYLIFMTFACVCTGTLGFRGQLVGVGSFLLPCWSPCSGSECPCRLNHLRSSRFHCGQCYGFILLCPSGSSPMWQTVNLCVASSPQWLGLHSKRIKKCPHFEKCLYTNHKSATCLHHHWLPILGGTRLHLPRERNHPNAVIINILGVVNDETLWVTMKGLRPNRIAWWWKETAFIQVVFIQATVTSA